MGKRIKSGKKDSMMVKIEDVQSYGKEHLETIAASASNLQSGVQAIATAYGDYAKKSFEDTKSFVEKLSGVKSLDKAMEAQTEYARSAYENFVARARRSPASTAISPSRPSSPMRAWSASSRRRTDRPRRSSHRSILAKVKSPADRPGFLVFPG